LEQQGALGPIPPYRDLISQFPNLTEQEIRQAGDLFGPHWNRLQREQVQVGNLPPLGREPFDQNWSHEWATDYILPPGATMTLDEMKELVDSQVSSWRGLGDRSPGYHYLQKPDGSHVIRVLHTKEDSGRPNIDRFVLEDTYSFSPAFREPIEAGGGTVQRGRVRAYNAQGDLAGQELAAKAYADQTHVPTPFNPTQGPIEREAQQWIGWDRADRYLQQADARGYANVVSGVRNRYRGEATARANTAYYRYLPGLSSEKRARNLIVNPATRGHRFQLGPQKNVRAATATDSELNSAIYFLKTAGPDSALHETFHVFARFFEDSMIEALGAAYKKATGRVGMRKTGGRPTLFENAEEWLAKEFEKYATTAKVGSVHLQTAFNTMGKLAKRHKSYGRLVKANEHVANVFNQLFQNPNSGLQAVPYNADEFRHLGAARYMMAAHEDEAHKTHYFARGRTFIERSVNHPYLGYYPASYMWGKVIPELVRFLVREPFGIKAPLWGYSMAQHVSEAFQLQLNTDPEFRDFLKTHPQFIRFFQMMLPGTPWDIPVNMPAWMRHTAREEARNQIREMTGEELKHAQPLNEIANSANYAFGIGRFIQTGQSIINEFNPEEEQKGPTQQEMFEAAFGNDLAAAEQELGPMLGR
jgi:hypothetical protein